MQTRHISVGTFTPTHRMTQLVNEVLNSGQISYGAKSRQFEQEMARLHHCRYGVLSNSGTSSLQVALQAMQETHLWERQHQVIVPVTTFIASANVVRHCQLRPIFVDVDARTFNIDPEKVAEVINATTRCIMPVHLLGQPADVTALKPLLDEEVKILEDSCEAQFATHHGQPVMSLGDIGVTSTYVAHLTVTGVGGLVLTNNPVYVAKIRSLVNHGLALDQLNPDENFAPQPMPGRRFIFDTYGHSFRLSEFEPALGLAQLETHQEMIRLRQRNAAHYRLRLDKLNQRLDCPLAWQEYEPHNTVVPMMQSLVLTQQNGKNVDKLPLMRHLNAHGIETRDLPSCLGHKVYSYLSPADYPVSQWLWESGFYVGCTQDMSIDDVNYVVDCLEGFFANGP